MSTCELVVPLLPEFTRLKIAMVCDEPTAHMKSIEKIEVGPETSLQYIKSLSHINKHLIAVRIITEFNHNEKYMHLPKNITDVLIRDFSLIPKGVLQSNHMLEYIIDRRDYITSFNLTRQPYQTLDNWSGSLYEFVQNNTVLKHMTFCLEITEQMIEPFSNEFALHFLRYAKHLESFHYSGPFDTHIYHHLMYFILDSALLKEIVVVIEGPMSITNFFGVWEMVLKASHIRNSVERINVQTAMALPITSKGRLSTFHGYLDRFYALLNNFRNSTLIVNGHTVNATMTSIEKRDRREYGDIPDFFVIVF